MSKKTLSVDSDAIDLVLVELVVRLDKNSKKTRKEQNLPAKDSGRIPISNSLEKVSNPTSNMVN